MYYVVLYKYRGGAGKYATTQFVVILMAVCLRRKQSLDDFIRGTNHQSIRHMLFVRHLPLHTHGPDTCHPKLASYITTSLFVYSESSGGGSKCEN